ncbi:methyl-accepting chemotaxis protein [Leeia aquatica]|uniref:PAS domain-containing protein n=1 Tax=Leeia aquatica TaxID=2725557 RepID=A0A847SGI3_9NEIS|nr:PAS domain-containing protein [Leeia aquatica]
MNLNALSVRNKLLGGFGILLLLLVLSALLTRNQVISMQGNMAEMSRRHFPRSVLANDVIDAVNGIARSIRTTQLADDKALVDEQRKKINDARSIIADRLKQLESAEMEPEERALLDKVKSTRDGFVADTNEFLRLFDSGDHVASKTYLLTKTRESQTAYLEAITALIDFETSQVKEHATMLEADGNATIKMVLLIGVAAVVIGVLLAFWITRSILGSLGGELSVALAAVKRTAAGDLQTAIPVKSGDSSSLLASMQQMQQTLRTAAEAAVANARIKSALDGVSGNVMIADNDRKIIYMNRAVLDMLRAAEADIRKDLPQFSTANLQGALIDTFHKNPAHQMSLLANLTSTYKSRIKVGGRTFDLIANPVKDEQGSRLGSVVEWADVTEQLAARERELQVAGENARIKSALDGVSSNVMIADNDRKIIYMNRAVQDMLRTAESDIRKDLPQFSTANLQGALIDTFHKNPAHQMNMLANLKATYRTKIQVGGRHFALIANPVFGEAGERLGSVVEWSDITQEVAVEQEVDSIIQAAGRGDFSQRIEMQGKAGFFKTLGDGVNRLMETSERGLNDIGQVFSALAQGDLTVKVVNDYEGAFGQLKEDSTTTIDRLTEIVLQIKEATDTINTASREIASGNQNLSQRTEEQAASLEETASSMEELTSTVKQNAENARQANQLARGASDIAVKGGEVVSEVVTTMQAISGSARKIEDIISVIDGIAFQTNILALNAAVEAARAGEQGRGFAVVASEVRNLAQRSAGAAKEIKALINDSVEKVDSGSKLVDEAGHTMEEIVTAVKRVTDIMSEISAASTEQSAGIEQVNTTITQMDDMTQQNAALVEQAAAAAESLQEQAQGLTISVSVFKLGGSSSRALAAPAPTAMATARAASPARGGSRPASLPKPVSDDGDWEEF